MTRKRPALADYQGDRESYYLDTADFYRRRARLFCRIFQVCATIAVAVLLTAFIVLMVIANNAMATPR